MSIQSAPLICFALLCATILITNAHATHGVTDMRAKQAQALLLKLPTPTHEASDIAITHQDSLNHTAPAENQHSDTSGTLSSDKPDMGRHHKTTISPHQYKKNIQGIDNCPSLQILK